MECERSQVIQKSEKNMPNLKLEILNSKQSEVPRPYKGGASLERKIFQIVPLDPAYLPAGRQGRACGALAGQMFKAQNSKLYDLKDRTLRFAKMVRNYVKNLPKTLNNMEDARQLIKASGSVGANYIEAEEALSMKDFVMRIKISRKEAKESGYWLELTEPKDDQIIEKQNLIREATELTNISGSIVEKSK
jgi:four helix bundle protein